jgi:hypothetical protein
MDRSVVMPSKTLNTLSIHRSIERIDFRRRATELVENLGLLINLFMAGIATSIPVQTPLETIRVSTQPEEPLA